MPMPAREPVHIVTLSNPGKRDKRGTKHASTIAWYPSSVELLPVGAYMRLSLAKPSADAQALALARQDCAGALTGLGVEVVADYTDPDHSAFKRNAPRPALDALLADLDAGRIRGLVVYDIDRLTRRHYVLEQIIDRYESDPELFWWCEDPAVDLRTESGRATARARVDGAYQEALAAQRRQKRRHDQLRAMGVQVAVKGYGYNADGKVIPAERMIIRRWATLVERGSALKPYLDTLAAQGVTTRTGQTITTGFVRRTLMSPRIVGYRVDGHAPDKIARDAAGEPISGSQAAILTVEQWERVKAVYGARAGYGRADLSSARRYLLSGLLVCGRCGHAMGGSWLKDRNRHRYICPGGNGRCGRNNVNGPQADGALRAYVEGVLAAAPAADEPREAVWPRQGEADRLTQTRADDLAALHADELDPETWADLERGHVMRLAELRKARRAWAAEQPAPVVSPTSAMTERWASRDLAAQREVLRACVGSVIVTPGGGWSPARLRIVPVERKP